MSPTSRKDITPRRSLVSEGSQVAFGPARSLTSHARRVYVERYLGRYRFAAAVFAFDAFLVGVALTLCVVTIVFLSIAPARFDGGLRIEARAAALRGSETSPFSIAVRAVDGRRHAGVRLRIQLPDWAEVIRTEPAAAHDGYIDLGDIAPQQAVTALALVRSRVADADLPISFHVVQDDWTGLVRNIEGSETRRVGPSVLSAAPDATVTSTAQGAVIPFDVRNTAATAVPSVIFRVAAVEGGEASLGGSDSFALGELGPGESRRLFVDVTRAASTTLSISWQVQDGAQAASSGTAGFPVVAGSSGVPDGRFASGGFPLDAVARYYTDGGDQVGVGPLPPKVGQATTYWLAFSLGPTEGPMKDLVIRASLPPGVRATGKSAAPVAAELTTTDDRVEWHVPTVSSIGSDKLTFAFEISFTPVKGQVGSAAVLLRGADAKAQTEDGRTLSASATLVTTELSADAKATGKGIVQP